MVLAIGRAILSIVYAQQERGRALGLASMAFHLGYISGPSVPGVLIDTVDWRWIFFLNLPVALTAAYMAWKVLPETPLQRQIHALDLPGMLTLFATAVTLTLSLQQIAKCGLSWVSLVIFPVAPISAVLLVRFERTNPAPFLDLSLFRIRVLRENPSILIGLKADPVVQSDREPSRSPNQPPSGKRKTITREKKITVTPTWVGEECTFPAGKMATGRMSLWEITTYTQWGENPAVFIRAFQNSWLLIAGLTAIAIVASSMRGVDKRQGQIISRHHYPVARNFHRVARFHCSERWR